MKIFFKPGIFASLFLVPVYFGLVNCSFAANGNVHKSYQAKEKYFDIGVKEVLSGDMIRLEDDQCLRLIAIDTPEVIEGNKLQFDSKVSNIPVEVLMVMGNEAKSLVEQLVEGKRLRIEFDKKNKDNYGDLLGYVFIISGKNNKEVFLNAEVIKNGYTYEIDSTPNNRYLSLFKKIHADVEKSQTSQLWRQWRR